MGNRLTYCIVVILILLCAILVLLPQSNHFAFSPKAANQSADWYMTDTHITKFNPQGNIAGLVTSPYLSHQEANNLILLQQPFFILYDDNQVPWHINAKNAIVYQSGDKQIILNNDVSVQQMPGPNSNNVLLKTSHLTYYPNTSLAKTNDAVVITEPGMTMTSIGFEADLKNGLLRFLSHSQGEYHDSKKP